MTDRLTLDVVVREELGTSPSKKVRKDNMVPAVIYGGKGDNIFVSLPKKEIDKLYLSSNLFTTILDLKINGKIVSVLPYQIDLSPIYNTPRHLDLMRVQEGKPSKVRVRLLFKGKEKSPGIKKGGYLNIIHRRIELLCDIKKIPHYITADISKSIVGDKVHVNDIKLPEGVTSAYKKDIIVATITGRGGKAEKEDIATEVAAEAAKAVPATTEKKEEKKNGK